MGGAEVSRHGSKVVVSNVVDPALRSPFESGASDLPDGRDMARNARHALLFGQAAAAGQAAGGAYQEPVFSIDVHGSAGSLEAPACRISIEIPSGERTNAMWPSRGGRLMVTPASIRRWQVA